MLLVAHSWVKFSNRKNLIYKSRHVCWRPKRAPKLCKIELEKKVSRCLDQTPSRNPSMLELCFQVYTYGPARSVDHNERVPGLTSEYQRKILKFRLGHQYHQIAHVISKAKSNSGYPPPHHHQEKQFNNPFPHQKTHPNISYIYHLIYLYIYTRSTCLLCNIWSSEKS